MKRVLLGCLLCALMMTPSFSKGKKMVIFVDNFVNLSSKEYDHFGAGIGKTVSNDFSYVPEFTVISFSDREEALNEIAFSQSGATKTEIKPGQMLAADYTCTGKYQIKGEDLAIHASFIDVRKRKPVVSVKIIGTIQQMREKQEQIVFVDWITGNLVNARCLGVLHQHVFDYPAHLQGGEAGVDGILEPFDRSLLGEKPLQKALLARKFPTYYRGAEGQAVPVVYFA